MTLGDIQEAVLRYEREHDRFVKLADVVYERCLRIVQDAGLRATVQRRAKQPQSLRKKLLQLQRKADARFSRVDDVFVNMGDLAAVRVATYLESDREKVVTELKKAFEFIEGTPERPNPDNKNKTGRAKHYRAIHCQVVLKSDDAQGRNANLSGTSCEIQVCSMLAHVWNEIEHDLGYKPETGALSDPEIDGLDALGQLIHAGDVIIKAMLDANRARVEASEQAFGNQFDFMARMQKQFPHATSFHIHASQLFDVLLEYGLDSPAKIAKELLGDDGNHQARAVDLANRLKAHVADDPVVDVDVSTSDQLAVLLLNKRVDDLLERYPSGRGMGRPMRLVSLAKRFKEMPVPALK